MLSTSPALASRLAAHVFLAIAGTAAGIISTRRTLVLLPVDAEEAATLGVPQGTASPYRFVSVSPSGCSLWRVDCWLDDDEENPEGCLHLEMLGLSAEVLYYRKGHDSATTRAYVNGLVSR